MLRPNLDCVETVVERPCERRAVRHTRVFVRLPCCRVLDSRTSVSPSLTPHPFLSSAPNPAIALLALEVLAGLDVRVRAGHGLHNEVLQLIARWIVTEERVF